MQTKPKKHAVEVRRYAKDQTPYGGEKIGAFTGDYGRYDVVEVVSRVLRAEPIGNFNPVFCTYKGVRCLVRSDEGDLSDPFRATDSYLTSLYIEAPPFFMLGERVTWNDH